MFVLLQPTLERAEEPTVPGSLLEPRQEPFPAFQLSLRSALGGTQLPSSAPEDPPFAPEAWMWGGRGVGLQAGVP